MSKNRFQASAEIGEIVSLFVNLNSFSIVLYFSIHAVRTLFERMLHRFARLGLKYKKLILGGNSFVVHYVTI